MSQAMLVWDGGSQVAIPPQMGRPLDTQMRGTTGEQLVELGTRACYDSLGLDADGEPKGRSTEDTLGNVMSVYHGSVLEHYVRTIAFPKVPTGEHCAFFESIAGRPGCFIRYDKRLITDYTVGLRVTMNVRAVVEWNEWSRYLCAENGYPEGGSVEMTWRRIGERLRTEFAQAVPLLVDEPVQPSSWMRWLLDDVRFVEPETDAEKWVSLYMVGSRGFSHEMVRHRFAMSQRSTRYCEEADSKWHWHPLITQFILENPHVPVFDTLLVIAQKAAQDTYRSICNELQDWLVKKLPENTPYRKKHARKQARGAGRGFLGNALETQMLYTAPVWGWKHVLRMRMADAADAEIRVVAVDAYDALMTSRYADRFADLVVIPASDGLGKALANQAE